MAHEIGHFISHQAIGKPKSYDFNNELFAGWLSAVSGSNAVTMLGKTGYKTDYYLSNHELWARCYAQYIAAKSGHELLLGQLKSKALCHSIYAME